MAMFENPFRTSYREVGPGEAREAVEAGAVLLDVREPEEWESGHAPEAVHIPLGELTARVDELPADKDVMVICRSGNRSARAAQWLSTRGGGEVANVAGGMAAWQQLGLPIEAGDGGPGHVA